MRKITILNNKPQVVWFFMAFLMLLSLVSTGQVTATYTFSVLGATNVTNPSGNIDSNISYTSAKNAGTTAATYNSGGLNLRLYYSNASPYSGSSINLTAKNGVTITGVEFESESTSYRPTMKYTIDSETVALSNPSIGRIGASAVYTVSGLNITSSMNIRNANTSNEQMRMMYIKVTYMPSGPTVTTTAATTITSTSAVLNGTINANNISTTASFEYGATTSYGSAVSASPGTVTGTTTTSISGNISSLSLNKQYHYRAVGTDGAVVTNGADMSFYTLAAIPGVLVVNNPQLTTIDVEVNSTTQNSNPSNTQYAIQENGGQYVQANGSLGATAVWQTAATWGTKTVTGLGNTTTYTFKTKARNGDNVETIFGATASETTLTPATVDWCNLQWPTSAEIFEGDTFTVNARVNEPGITDSPGEGTAIDAWIGYSAINGNPDDTWTWIPASYFGDDGTNNDEYSTLLGAGIDPGTYYYASRFNINGGPYTYGGKNNAIWASNADNAVLLVKSKVVDWCNIQYPTSGTITEGMSYDVYAQVKLEGITNPANQGAGITAEIGYSTTNGTPNGTWTWIAATYNVDAGDNDEYKTTFSALPIGTYYYASRFIRTGSTEYKYGGTSGIWNNDSGVLTVDALGTPDATAATSVGSTSFTANWDAVTNATSYELDVYTMDLGASPELVVNGGFETGNVSSWTFESSMNQVASTVQTHTGTYSMYSTVSATKNFKQAISVVSGEEYTLGFWYYIDGSSTGNGFRVWTTTGADIKLPSSSTFFNTQGTWQYVEQVFTPSSNTMDLNFRLYNGVKIYIDDISVTLNASSPVATPIAGSPFTISAPTTFYDVTGVDPDTTYSYVVRAILSSNTSANSNQIDVTTTASAITWNGSEWSNTIGPDATKDAIINGDYEITIDISAKNLTINPGFTVTVQPTNALTVEGDLVNNGSIIFKSSATGTARFAAYSGAPISGNGSTTVERHIPAKRAWRLISAPLKGSAANSIFANWQNNGATADGSTGILLWNPTGSASPTSSTTGMFLGPQANIKTFNAGAWTEVSNTNETQLFNSDTNNGFLTFPTGPHASDNISGTAAATTARATGSLITGTVSHTLVANQFKMIANPYASPLNTAAMFAHNPANTKMWVIDPSIGLGAYVTYDGENWSMEQTGNDANIQSGQAFFVRNATADNFTIIETDKVSGNSNNWFEKTSADQSSDKIRVQLFKQVNANWSIADGILAVNHAEGNNGVDAKDAIKISNFNENILFKNGASNLAIEYKNLPQSGDMQPLHLTATTAIPYQLRLFTEGYTNSTLQPYLEDTQMGSFTEIPVDGNLLIVPFTGVVATAANPDARFRIVYQNALSTTNPTLQNVSVFPNPVVNNQFNINLGANNTDSKYTITNLLGQFIQQGSLINAQNSISIPSVATGIYILSVNQENKSFTTKIYVQ